MLKRLIVSFILLLVFISSIGYANNFLIKKDIAKTNQDNLAFYYREDVTDNSIIGVLSIPKINLERGFYSKSSPLNDLSKNIYYLQESIPLEEENSMIILAAHRGTSNVAFFNDLDKLKIGDTIFLDYKHESYTYILKEIYDEEKDGRLNIYRDSNKDSLILITCNKYKKKYQTIYVSYRKDD